MAGLVCRYIPIDWIPAFAGMTRYGFGFNKLVMLPILLISLMLTDCGLHNTKPPEPQEITNEDRALNYMPGEVLVEFKREVTEQRIGLLSEKLSISIIEKLKGTEIYRFRLPPGVAVDEAVEKLKQMSEVKYAQPNYIYQKFKNSL